jgi:hypothetical protein
VKVTAEYKIEYFFSDLLLSSQSQSYENSIQILQCPYYAVVIYSQMMPYITVNDKGNIILYTTPDGEAKIEVTLQDETVWLTLDQMAELFQRNKSTISRHIKNIFETGELNADSTVAFFATVQTEGKRKVERNLAFYNLDMIISVGYRVNSYRGVQFRSWAYCSRNHL